MNQPPRMTKAQLLKELEEAHRRISALEAQLESKAPRERLSNGSEDMFMALADAMPAGLFIYRYDPPETLTLLYGNPEASTLTGVTPQDWIGHEFDEIWPEARAQGVTGAFLEVMRSGNAFKTEDLTYEDEKLRGAFRIHAFPLGDDRLAVSFENITERKQMEENLRESEERFRMLFDRAPLGYHALDEDGNLTDVNQAWLDLLGRDRQDVLGRSFGDFLTAESNRAFNLGFPRFKAAGRILGAELEMVKGDGTTALISIDGKVGHDKKGRIKQIHCILQDVTERRKAERALFESEALFRAVVEDQTDMIVRWLPDGMRTFVNGAYCRAFGEPADTLIGTSFFPLIAEEDREWVRARLEAITPDRPVSTAEHRVKRPDGSMDWQEWTDRGVFDPEGKLIEYQSVGRDVTERRELEERLRLTQFAVDNSPDAIFRLRPDGRIVEVNRAGTRLTGYTREALFSMAVYDLDPAVSRQTWPRVWDRITAEGSFLQEAELQGREGPPIPVELLVNHVEYDGQEFAAVVARDISERMAASAALQAERDRAQQYLDVAEVMLLGVDSEGRVNLVNRSGLRLLEYEKEEDLIGRNWFDTCLPEESRSGTEEVYRGIMSGEVESPLYRENRVLTRSGGERLVAWRSSVVHGQEGEALGVLGSGVDITEQVEAQRALEKSEERYRTLFETAPIGMARTDAEGNLTMSNPALRGMLGYEEDELSTLTFDAFTHPADIEEELRKVNELRAGRRSRFQMEKRYIRKDGEIIWGDLHMALIPGSEDKDRDLLGMAVDITKRKRAEASSRMSEEKYRKLFDMSPNPHALVALPGGRFVDVSPKLAETFGFTREEMIGRTSTELGIIIPEQREEQLALMRKEGGARLLELSLQAKGEERRFLSSAEFLDLEGEEHILWEFLDVTEKKALEDQVRQAQKLETLGTLASGIAHDFNNLLVPILGYADLAHGGASPGDLAMKGLERHLFDAADRARELVEQILTFGRKEEQERKILRPEVPVRNALRLLDATLPASTKIRRRFTEPIRRIHANGNQLQQVVTNLCTNALHAMEPDGGVIELSLETVELDDVFEQLHPEFRGRHAVRLTVKDRGIGMEQDVVERVFEPFFTTKEVGAGTGLGLSVVHGIVTGHGGVIEVTSVVDEGSTFEVYLPPAEEEAAGEDTEIGAAPRGTERILFVDDEEATCDTAQRLLEPLGYGVTTSLSGSAALQLFRERPEEFDLVVTDFDMPRMNGIHLAVELMEGQPDLPVLLVTGTHEGRVRAAENLGLRGYVRKPFTAFELSSAIRRALDE